MLQKDKKIEFYPGFLTILFSRPVLQVQVGCTGEKFSERKSGSVLKTFSRKRCPGISSRVVQEKEQKLMNEK